VVDREYRYRIANQMYLTYRGLKRDRLLDIWSRRS